MAGFFVADINRTPLSRLRERGWGRGLGETKSSIEKPLSLTLSRKRERGFSTCVWPDWGVTHRSHHDPMCLKSCSGKLRGLRHTGL